MIKSALQKFRIKLNTILNGRKVKINKFSNELLKRKVWIDFFKLFKEATVLTSARSLFQSAAAAKERAKCRQYFLRRR